MRDQLLERMRSLGSCIVAFSGGVDSAVVLQAAYLALGNRAVGVTGVSASLAERERHIAARVAKQIGARHHWVATGEQDEPNYRRNAIDRCYHCKTELYSVLTTLAHDWNINHIVNGTNADDLGEYRPGLQAGTEAAVVSPLAELGIDKQGVRELARLWKLPVWNKPSSPCLASRIAYGVEVTPDRLAMVECTEAFLHDHGFDIVRVRYHENNAARIEVPIERIPELVEPHFHAAFLAVCREVGFQQVTVDLQGFRSGSLVEIQARCASE